MRDDPVGRLPDTLPIFPLSGALLLPHGHLPLHIFEPRYRTLVEAALCKGRLFGMVQPRFAYAQPTPDNAEIFSIGCAGRIISFSETDDGRFMITLRGVCRFRIIEELPLQDGYRLVKPDYRPFAPDLVAPEEAHVDRERLLNAAKTFFEIHDIASDWSAAEQASSAALITTLAMVCPFEPREKQALLECATHEQRCDMLTSLFEMAVLEGNGPASETPN